MIVSELLYESLRLAGVIQLAGRTASTTEMADAFSALNALIEALNTEQINLIEHKTFSLSAGVASYTIGTGATWNTTRPNKILAAHVTGGVVDRNVQVCTPEQWAAVENKGEQTSLGPRALFYDAALTGSKVLVAPTSVGVMSIALLLRSELPAFANQAATVTLPPGYIHLVKYRLAVELAQPHRFSRAQMDPTVIAIAQAATAEIKALNLNPQMVAVQEAA